MNFLRGLRASLAWVAWFESDSEKPPMKEHSKYFAETRAKPCNRARRPLKQRHAHQ